MKLTEFLLAELDREVERSRRALEQAPEGKYDWKPHEKSMIFGYLANMVATIPMWIATQINQAELDVALADGGSIRTAEASEHVARIVCNPMPLEKLEKFFLRHGSLPSIVRFADFFCGRIAHPLTPFIISACPSSISVVCSGLGVRDQSSWSQVPPRMIPSRRGNM